MAEQFLNDRQTTLNGAINNSVTSITVTDGSVFPATGNFRIRIGTELLLVTARSTHVLTVTRGAESSTAASHSSLDTVQLVLTAASLLALITDYTPPTIVTFVLHNGESVATGTNKTNAIIVPHAGTITRCDAYCKTAPTGSDLIMDINKGGTTIWSTQANRITIAASAQTGTQSSFNTTTVAQGDILTIDIDQIGSTIPGATVTVELHIQKTP